MPGKRPSRRKRTRPLVLRAEFAYRAPDREQERLSRIDLNIVWDDAKAMGSANRDLLTAVAGMFLLLPGILADQFMTSPEKMPVEPGDPQVLQQLADYASANWQVLLLHGIVTSFGVLVLQTLLLRSERLTVGESLRAALPLLPGYVIASIGQGLGVMSGLMLFLLPGFYLIGRLALIAPVAAAEGETNPLTILRRSAMLTHGNGWRIFGVLAVIFATMMIVGLVATSLIGLAAELLLRADLADFVMSLVSGLLETALALVVVLVSAALYRATTASVARSWQP